MLSSATANETETSHLTWTKDLAIDHEMIDEDHQHIFATANKLMDELREQAEQDGEEPEHSVVGEVLFELIDHTGGHFSREEELMQSVQFPRYEDHKREHEFLMQKVNNLHRRFMDGRANVAADVAEFLRKWMIPHIMHSDKALGRHIQGDK